MSNPTPTTRKPRAAAHIWKRVYELNGGSRFFVGKILLWKTSPITARIVSTGDLRFVNPFRRVRTEQLVKKVPATFPHYMGDVCRAAESCNLTKTSEVHDCDYDREPVAQPNSDNGITGPTS